MHEQLSSALTEKIEILTLVLDDETGALSWVSERKRWAAVKLDSQRNLFSAVGVGARGVTVTIRPDRRLTLRDAIRWNGEFLHLTAISMGAERDRQEIRAAICHPEMLTAKPQDRTTPSPASLQNGITAARRTRFSAVRRWKGSL